MGPWHRGQRRAHDRHGCSDTVNGGRRRRPNSSDLRRRCGPGSSVRRRYTDDDVAQLSEDVQLMDQPDEIVWKWTADGKYTAKSVCEIQFRGKGAYG
ncbi:unnamed protein product [Urochloa humidicola]